MHALKCFSWQFKKETALSLFILTLAGGAVAQTLTNTFTNAPIVTVQATDPFATWSGDTGTFTIHRAGNTNPAITVFYALSGTASNGVDYSLVPNHISLASGVVSTSIVINPINLGQMDVRTVGLEVVPSPLANPLNDYRIGFPRAATVYIGPDRTNVPPGFVVRITSPPNGAVFRGPLDLPIFAYSHPTSGPTASVEFFANGSSLGLGHPISSTVTPGLSNFFTLTWSNASPGAYALTAKATDTNSNTAFSQTVNISILSFGPPPTNRPPVVNIVATDPVAIEGTNCWPWRGLAAGPLTWSNWLGSTAAWRFFTNCGPKNAIFTVRRLGDTNDTLTVDYAIGGTASNGVDYATLPSSVTIPAGQRSALITLVPIDDGAPDITSTVILKLQPSSTTNYLLGFPRAAGAIILDGPSTHPAATSAMLPGSAFHLSASGPDGAWFHVESSADLVNWSSICTNQVISGSIDFIDPDSQTEAVRFYRAVPESAPAPF